MSTCPSKDLYSVYIDGELPSPWKEKLEDHFKTCNKCKNIVKKYECLKAMLKDSSSPNIDLDASFQRLKQKESEYKFRQNNLDDRVKSNKTNWLMTSVKVPVSIVAVAALFLFVFTPLLLLQIKQSKTTQQIVFSNFRPIIPGSKVLKVNAKELNFNELSYKDANYVNFAEAESKRYISFNNFADLYMPVDTDEEPDIKFQSFDMDAVLFQKVLEQFTINYAKNGQ